MVTFDEEDEQTRHLEEYRAQEAEDLARELADKYGVRYVNLAGIPINTNALRLIPEKQARENDVAAFDIVDKDVHVAARIPSHDGVQEIIKKLKKEGYRPHLYICSKKSLEKAWKRYEEISYAEEKQRGMLEISTEEVEKFAQEVHDRQEVKERLEEAMSSQKGRRVTRIVEIIIGSALSLNASDIHIEPKKENVEIRMRLDGVLVPLAHLNHETHQLLVSRVKLLSGLKLNINDAGQDGRLTINLNEKDIEVRTSILPGNNGESIVLRVLDPTQIVRELDELGMGENLQEIMEKEIHKPNGVILNTGPTGSGKTTTLFAFLTRINEPGLKIVTIENPVEYHIEGITQTQIDEANGYTFFEGLTSTLRQDPDVIMVGEIRKAETAKTVIHAGLTGHLVFTTLHTNTAAGAFPRLVELEVDPEIISSAVNVSMAQRLVKKLCPECKREREITKEEEETIQQVIDTFEDTSEVGELWPVDTLWEAEGCEACNDMGYKGRIGVFEAVLVDEDVEEALRESPTEREIAKATRGQGIHNMAQDGILKVLKGITDLEELRREIELVEHQN